MRPDVLATCVCCNVLDWSAIEKWHAVAPVPVHSDTARMGGRTEACSARQRGAFVGEMVLFLQNIVCFCDWNGWVWQKIGCFVDGLAGFWHEIAVLVDKMGGFWKETIHFVGLNRDGMFLRVVLVDMAEDSMFW